MLCIVKQFSFKTRRFWGSPLINFSSAPFNGKKPNNVVVNQKHKIKNNKKHARGRAPQQATDKNFQLPLLPAALPSAPLAAPSLASAPLETENAPQWMGAKKVYIRPHFFNFRRSKRETRKGKAYDKTLVAARERLDATVGRPLPSEKRKNKRKIKMSKAARQYKVWIRRRKKMSKFRKLFSGWKLKVAAVLGLDDIDTSLYSALDEHNRDRPKDFKIFPLETFNTMYGYEHVFLTAAKRAGPAELMADGEVADELENLEDFGEANRAAEGIYDATFRGENQPNIFGPGHLSAELIQATYHKKFFRSRMFARMVKGASASPLGPVGSFRFVAATKAIRRKKLRLTMRPTSSDYFHFSYRRAKGSWLASRSLTKKEFWPNKKLTVRRNKLGLKSSYHARRRFLSNVEATIAASYFFTFSFGYLLSRAWKSLLRKFFIFKKINQKGLNRSRIVVLSKPGATQISFYNAFSRIKSAATREILSAVTENDEKTHSTSPFVSGSHFIWINKILRTSAPKSRMAKLFRSSGFSTSLFNSVFGSRTMFFQFYKSLLAHGPDQFWPEGEAIHNARMLRETTDSLYFRLNDLIEQWLIVVEARKSLGTRGIDDFKIERNADQAADAIFTAIENRPFWRLNAGLTPAGATYKFSVWEPRIKKLVTRQYAAYSDPFATRPNKNLKGELEEKLISSPFSDYSNLSAKAKSIKFLTRSFYSIFLAIFKKELYEARRKSPLRKRWRRFNIHQNSDYNFIVLLKYLLNTISREYGSVMADYSLTLFSVLKGRKFFKKVNRDTGEVYARAELFKFYHDLGGKRKFGAYFDLMQRLKNDWNLTPSRDFFNKFMLYVSDERGLRLMHQSPSIPTNYFFTMDLALGSFSNFSAANSAAVVKFFSDSCKLINADYAFDAPNNASMFAISHRASRALWLRSRLRELKQEEASLDFKSKTWSAVLYEKKIHAKLLSALFLYNKWAISLANIYGFSLILNVFRGALKLALYPIGKTSLAEYDAELRTVVDRVASSIIFGNKFRTPSGLEKRFARAFVYLLQKITGVRAALFSESFRELTEAAEGLKVAGNIPLLRLLAEDYSDYSAGIKISNYFLESGPKTALFELSYIGSSRSPFALSHVGNVLQTDLNNSSSFLSKIFSKSVFWEEGPLPKDYSALKSTYVHLYIMARRVCDFLSLGFEEGDYRRSVLTQENPNLMKVALDVNRNKQFLLKNNPDIAGRSRTFYFLKKKKFIRTKKGRAFKFVRFTLRAQGFRSKGMVDARYNTYSRKMRMVSGRNKNKIRLKMYLRHIQRMCFKSSSKSLFYKWKSIKETSRKWLTYYRYFEAILVRYVRHVGLIPASSIGAEDAIRGGLISINGEVCVNPFYVVRSGDVLTLNNEAYWTIMSRRIDRSVRKYLPSDLPGHTTKKLILDRALKLLRRAASRAEVSAAISLEEKNAIQRAGSLFVADRTFSHIPRKPLAPGGAKVGKEEIFFSDPSGFSPMLSDEYKENRKRFEHDVNRILKYLNDSRVENGKFFYRFHNSVFVIRAPASARELLSKSKKKITAFYNPRVMGFFISHRFWH